MFAFPSHLRNYNPRLLITTWNKETVVVTISQIPGHTQTQKVSYGNFIDIDFTPLTGDSDEPFQTVALIVQATDYVYVYACAIVSIMESFDPFRNHHVMSDGFLAIPMEHMGTEYYVVSYFPSFLPSTLVITALAEENKCEFTFLRRFKG